VIKVVEPALLVIIFSLKPQLCLCGSRLIDQVPERVIGPAVGYRPCVMIPDLVDRPHLVPDIAVPALGIPVTKYLRPVGNFVIVQVSEVIIHAHFSEVLANGLVGRVQFQRNIVSFPHEVAHAAVHVLLDAPPVDIILVKGGGVDRRYVRGQVLIFDHPVLGVPIIPFGLSCQLVPFRRHVAIGVISILMGGRLGQFVQVVVDERIG